MKNLWLVLLPSERRAIFLMLTLMLIGMLLETLGVGIIIPALALMTEKGAVSGQSILGHSVPEWFANQTGPQIVTYGMLLLAFVYFVKSVFLAFLAWRQSKFIYGIEISLSKRLFSSYLRQPYSFHLQRNSAQLIQHCTNEVAQFSRGAVRSLMTLITEFLVMIGIGSLLIAVEPFGALLIISTLGLTGSIFYWISKRHLVRWGRARQYHEGKRIQHLQQGLGGAKDVKLLGRESDFLARYDLHNREMASIVIRQSTLEALPRLWLELLAVVGLVVLVISMLAQGKPVESLVPTIGLFAAAAFRLMPSANRVLTTLQNFKYASPVIEVIRQELDLTPSAFSSASAERLPFCRELSLQNVNYTYLGANEPALSDVSLEIKRGTTVGFIGGSGAGKSTLIDVMLGLLAPDHGYLLIDGKNIKDVLRSWQNQIGYVPQTIFLTDDTLRRNIAFGLEEDQIDDAAIERAVDAAQLTEFVESLPGGLNTVVGERGVRLSGGQRQRIGIARALYHDPAVLVLDEATSSLDITTERGVMRAVNALHGAKTILIVAHRLSTVERCDCVVHLERGRVLRLGSPEKLLDSSLDFISEKRHV